MKDRALKRRLFKTATYITVAACVIVLGLALHSRISGTDLVSAVSAYRQAANRNIILISVDTL